MNILKSLSGIDIAIVGLAFVFAIQQFFVFLMKVVNVFAKTDRRKPPEDIEDIKNSVRKLHERLDKFQWLYDNVISKDIEKIKKNANSN